jgi:hypothetical protein
LCFARWCCSPAFVLPISFAGLGEAIRQAFYVQIAHSGLVQGGGPSGADTRAQVFQERS